MAEMSFAEKIVIVKAIKNELISFPAYRYRKLRDLLTFCEDPKDVDVVLKAMAALAEVFCDIIPSYKIRELGDRSQPNENGEESKAFNPKIVKVSKEVEALQQQEQYTLKCYKDYLQVLEVFSKLKVDKLSKHASDKEKACIYYAKLHLKSVECFAMLLERHPHFNYRLNILAVLA